ncbi:flagellin [Clostridia bacterium]|nr:flagellin [Clostridia bacterium]
MQTGLGILRPSDNLAGSMMANQLRATLEISRQGIRNLNEVQAIVGVVESSMTTLSGILQEIGALALQAAGPARTTDQVRAIQDAAHAAGRAFNAALRAAKYNGVELLSGRFAARPMAFGEGLVTLQFANLSADAIAALVPTQSFTAITLIQGGGALATPTQCLSIVDRMRLIVGAFESQRSIMGSFASRLDALVDARSDNLAAMEDALSLIEDVPMLESQVEAGKAAALAEGSEQGLQMALSKMGRDVQRLARAFSVIMSIQNAGS